MKPNNRFIFGLLSLLLSAVTAFVALPAIARQTNGKTEIVRVTAPIPRGEKVNASNTEIVEVGSYNLPAGTARSLDDVDGLYATAGLSPGDYILPSKVSAMPVSSDAALNSIPSGKVAISLSVKTLASGLSDKLQPEDIIRIYHFLDTAEEVPELRFVRVLSVTDADGLNVDNTKAHDEGEEKQQSATITVLASPEQARTITALENDGVAHVALVCRGNEKLAAELLEEQESALQEIYFPEPLLPEETDENGNSTEPTSGDNLSDPSNPDASSDNSTADATNASGQDMPVPNTQNNTAANTAAGSNTGDATDNSADTKTDGGRQP